MHSRSTFSNLQQQHLQTAKCNSVSVSIPKTAFSSGSLIRTGKLVPLLATEPELEGGHGTSAWAHSHGGTQNGWFLLDPLKMDDLGVPPSLVASRCQDSGQTSSKVTANYVLVHITARYSFWQGILQKWRTVRRMFNKCGGISSRWDDPAMR